MRLVIIRPLVTFMFFLNICAKYSKLWIPISLWIWKLCHQHYISWDIICTYFTLTSHFKTQKRWKRPSRTFRFKVLSSDLHCLRSIFANQSEFDAHFVHWCYRPIRAFFLFFLSFFNDEIKQGLYSATYNFRTRWFWIIEEIENQILK